MKQKFIIETYELHSHKYEVEGDDIVEAVANFYHGEGEDRGEGSTYIQPAESYGMSGEANAELLAKLQEQGLLLGATKLEGIRSIEPKFESPEES